MKAFFSKTGLGLLAALLLVLLFYGRMLGEAQDTLAPAKKARDEAKEQATKDTEAQRHRELVSALHATSGPAAKDTSG
jgi:Na+-transporting methylmalonyl-CoA/oxaloacetate decarboxylase gamma subunit